MFFENNSNSLIKSGLYATVTIKVPLTKIEPFKSQVAKAKTGPKGIDDASLIAYQKIYPVTKMKLGTMGKPPKINVGKRTVFLCCIGCAGAIKDNPEKFMAIISNDPKDGILAIPAIAVIDTGVRKIVYRESVPGMFEAIEVILGPRVNDHYPVVSGLYPGDKIASSGSFLVDAETRLNPAQADAYFGASGTASQKSSSSVTK